jgi:NAD+ kinase
MAATAADLRRWRVMQPFTLAPAPPTATVGVLAQSASSCAAQLLTIRAWAARHSLEVVDLGTSAEPNGVDPGCQLVIALGGDGTILRALQLAMAHHAAVLGVNFGHVGFLADIAGDELAEALERLAGGQALLDERTALVAETGAQPARRFIAFNDVVVARLPGFGLARLRVVVAGESLLVLQGDGIVIASPTGSTAYTVGAGGPAVAPSLDAIVITPLASQGTPLRSLVVDGSEVVRVELESGSAPLSIEIDGRETHAMPAPAPLEIRAAARKARLVRTRPRTFYRDLATRL